MRQEILERGPEIRRWILLGLVVGVPAFFLRMTSDPFAIPKFALLILGVGLVAGLRAIEILQGAAARSLARAALPATALVVGLGGAWIFSAYRGWALIGLHGRLQGLLPYLLVALFGILVADAFGGHSSRLAEGLVWGGVVVGGYALVQTLGLDPFRWSLFGAPTTAVSTTGNPNFTGGFLGIVMPVALALVLWDPARRSRNLKLLAVIAAGWLAARSQGGWAAGVGGSALVLGAYYKDRWRWSFSAGCIAAIVVAGGTAGVVLLNIVAPDTRLALDAFSARGGWWEAAARMFADSPLIGAGPDVFGIEGVSHRDLDDALRFNVDFPNDPHSVPFNMLANGGLLGFLGWSIPIGWALWLAFRRRGELMSVAFGAAVAAYLIQSLVSIDELSLRVALWSALGGLAARAVGSEDRSRGTARSNTRAKRRKPRTANGSLKAWPAVGAVTLVVMGLVGWAGSLVVADARVLHGQQLMASDEVDAARDAFESAFALRDPAEYRGRLALELQDLAFSAPEQERREYFVAARDAFTSYIEDVPFVFSIFSYGRMLDRWAVQEEGSGDPEAVLVLETALSIDPLNPLIRADLGAALNHLDRFDEAIAVLEPQFEVVPPSAYAPYWAALALAAAHTGDTDTARTALENTRAIDPANETADEAEQVLDRNS